MINVLSRWHILVLAPPPPPFVRRRLAVLMQSYLRDFAVESPLDHVGPAAALGDIHLQGMYTKSFIMLFMYPWLERIKHKTYFIFRYE